MAPRKRATGGRCERINLSPAGVHRPGIELTAADAAVRGPTRARHAADRSARRRSPAGSTAKCCRRTRRRSISSPVEPNAYLRYVEHLVERYGTRSSGGRAGTSPTRRPAGARPRTRSTYAELLSQPVPARSSAVNLEARLAMAAIAGTDLAFLRGVLDQLDGERCFDAIAVHPYRWRDPSGDAVRDVRLEDGVSVRLDDLEGGADRRSRRWSSGSATARPTSGSPRPTGAQRQRRRAEGPTRCWRSVARRTPSSVDARRPSRRGHLRQPA